MSTSTTISCQHAAPPRAVLHFPAGAGVAVCCWRCALGYRPMLRRSVRIALVVGTLLALINHGDHLIRVEVTAGIGLKILLTYMVPFAVATWSALVNSRVRKAS
jgi:hypothetical protein